MRKGALTGLAVLALAVPSAATADIVAAGPQGLDTRFGGCGILTPPNVDNGLAQELDRTAGGDVVAAGTVNRRTFALARFSPDGVLDSMFGGDGAVTFEVPRPAGAQDAELTGLEVQPDGKIVISGFVRLENPRNTEALLARFNPDGTLDSLFASDGVVEDALPALVSAEIDDIALAPDGGILAAGLRNDGADPTFGDPADDRFAVARYRPDGSLDPAFGTGGVATVDPGFGGSRAQVVRVLAGGRIVAGGQAGEQFALVGLLPTGAPDPSFGDGGASYESPPASARITALDVLPDGRLVAAGRGTNVNGRDQVVLARYTANGNADPAFGSGGFRFDRQASSPNDVEVTADGKLVVTGVNGFNGGGLLRYLADGSRDPAFGLGGGIGGFSSYGFEAHDLLLAADGTALAAVQDGLAFGVARFAIDEPALAATADQARACSARATTKNLRQLLRPGKKARYGKLNFVLNLRQPGRVTVKAVARVGTRSARIGTTTVTSMTFGKAIGSIAVSRKAARLMRGARRAAITLTAQGTEGGDAFVGTRTLRR
jgi:uncharacterized delta-60 repeat protein